MFAWFFYWVGWFAGFVKDVSMAWLLKEAHGHRTSPRGGIPVTQSWSSKSLTGYIRNATAFLVIVLQRHRFDFCDESLVGVLEKSTDHIVVGSTDVHNLTPLYGSTAWVVW